MHFSKRNIVRWLSLHCQLSFTALLMQRAVIEPNVILDWNAFSPHTQSMHPIAQWRYNTYWIYKRRAVCNQLVLRALTAQLHYNMRLTPNKA